jgi:hypothetical protein
MGHLAALHGGEQFGSELEDARLGARGPAQGTEDCGVEQHGAGIDGVHPENGLPTLDLAMVFRTRIDRAPRSYFFLQPLRSGLELACVLKKAPTHRTTAPAP